MPSLALLIPSGLDLAGWGGVAFAVAALTGLGRLSTWGRAQPEAALIAGWGAAALVLTLWGVATPTSLRFPAFLLVGLGYLAYFLPGTRLRAEEVRAMLRIVVLALPLIAVMVSARPSQPDTWLNLLPNAAYLYDHGFFPADARPPAHSFIPGAPYNMQLAAFIASLVTPGFPPSAMIGFNLIVQLAAALLLARIAAGRDDEAPSWALAALGLLLATALNPGFVPRYHLAAYSEPSVTVTVAFAGWFAARALDRRGGGREWRLDLWLLALALSALINIKQESIMLVVSLFVAAATLALVAGVDRARAMLGLAVAALPALILYFAWRWYVLSHFELGELKNLPLDEWHIFALPQILWNMARAAFNRAFLFLCVLAVVAVAFNRLRRRELDLATRLAAMLAGVAIVYNAALAFAYVAHFEGEMGIGAHSYFRYNTHLGLLLMVAIVALARSWGWSRLGARAPRLVPTALVLVALLDPFPFLRLLRFDLEVPNLRVFELARQAAPYLAADEQLTLLLPSDNGSVAPALEGVLRYVPPRRPALNLSVATDPAILTKPGEHRLLLSCASHELTGVPPGSAALLAPVGSGWHVVAEWPYPPVPATARWSEVLAPAPLCLGG